MVISGGGRFRELEFRYSDVVWATVWDPNIAIGIGDLWRWSVGELLEDIFFGVTDTGQHPDGATDIDHRV